MNAARVIRRTSVLLAFLPALVVEDVLKPLVDYDLVLVLFDAPEAGVCLEAGETGIGHGGGRLREQDRVLQPISAGDAQILGA